MNTDYIHRQDGREYGGYFFKLKPIQPEFDNLLGKYKTEAPIPSSASPIETVFPSALKLILPADVFSLCEEFNMNLSTGQKNSCMLLLRRILPLAIIRNLQKNDDEQKSRNDSDTGYKDTAALLDESRALVSEDRKWREVKSYKFLFDMAQHSYTYNPSLEEDREAGRVLRVFLEDIFSPSRGASK